MRAQKGFYLKAAILGSLNYPLFVTVNVLINVLIHSPCSNLKCFLDFENFIFLSYSLKQRGIIAFEGNLNIKKILTVAYVVS